jgi:sugar O-acyltransferase (sialic acid O-acetyltransferase NeuD family)
MNKRCVLVGAGGFGREVICWAEHASAAGTIPKVSAYLDDNPNALDARQYGIARLGGIWKYKPKAEDVFLLGVGDHNLKKKIVTHIASQGGQFASLIHPTAVIARTARIGAGAIVCPFALVSADAVVGDFVTINTMSSIGHDVEMGDYCTLSSHVDITAAVKVGAGVFFGSGARVMPQVAIDAEARIGAGAVVLRSVARGVTVFAQPARKLK